MFLLKFHCLVLFSSKMTSHCSWILKWACFDSKITFFKFWKDLGRHLVISYFKGCLLILFYLFLPFTNHNLPWTNDLNFKIEHQITNLQFWTWLDIDRVQKFSKPTYLYTYRTYIPIGPTYYLYLWDVGTYYYYLYLPTLFWLLLLIIFKT